MIRKSKLSMILSFLTVLAMIAVSFSGVPSGHIQPGSMTYSSVKNGKAENANIQHSLNPTQKDYRVTFSQTGLPTGFGWTVTINNTLQDYSSSGKNLNFSLQNGTYSYRAHVPFSIYDWDGTFVVAGTNLVENINLTLSPFGQKLYDVIFVEKGLPINTNWGYYVTQSYGRGNYEIGYQTSTALFSNGTFSFYTFNSYNDVRFYFNLTINGTGTTITSNFGEKFTANLSANTGGSFKLSGNLSGILYNDFLSESYLNGSVYAGSNLSITAVPDQNYSFVRWEGSINSTSETIYIKVESNITETAVFSPEEHFHVNFYEQGLPIGTKWFVNLSNGIKNSSVSNSLGFSLVNGTYNYTISALSSKYVAEFQFGDIAVNGSSRSFDVQFMSLPVIHLVVNPAGAKVAVGRVFFNNTLLVHNLTVDPGYIFINVTDQGYQPVSQLLKVSLNGTYNVNISLEKLVSYGYLVGALYSNGNLIGTSAYLNANGLTIPVENGTFNVTLSPGTYFITANAAGYSSASHVVSLENGQATHLNITLNKTQDSYTVSGYITSPNASLTFNGISPFLNETGYYIISIPKGNYVVSAYSPGYFPYVTNISVSSDFTMNISLFREPAPTSTNHTGNVTASGFNVSIGKMNISNGIVNLTYSSTSNGTLSISVPYNVVKNLTISQILDSKVYINNTLYHNFSVAITSNLTVILTVSGLNGDPTLSWVLNPSVTITKLPFVPPSTPVKNLQYAYYVLAILAIVVAIFAGMAWKFRRRKV